MAREGESARYRKAAQLALEQLDWCIEYLRRIHKNALARALARNRSVVTLRLQESREDKG